MIKIVPILILLVLAGCTSTYQPIKNRNGYVVIPNNDSYFIEYHGTDRNFVETSWVQAANETCPSGYKVLSQDEQIINGSFKSPVAGQMVNLGTQDFLQLGEIKCDTAEPPKTNLTELAWKRGNAQEGYLFSNAFIAKQISMKEGQVRFMSKASTAKLVDYFDWKFGDAVFSENEIKIWNNRATTIPNGIIVNSINDCPEKITIIPPALMLTIYMSKNKNYDELLALSKGTYSIKPICGVGVSESSTNK